MDRGSKIYRKKYCSNLNCICNCFQLIYTRTYLFGFNPSGSCLIIFQHIFYPLFNSLGLSSPTHSLQIYCTGLIGPILGPQNVSLQVPLLVLYVNQIKKQSYCCQFRLSVKCPFHFLKIVLYCYFIAFLYYTFFLLEI